MRLILTALLARARMALQAKMLKLLRPTIAPSPMAALSKVTLGISSSCPVKSRALPSLKRRTMRSPKSPTLTWSRQTRPSQNPRRMRSKTQAKTSRMEAIPFQRLWTRRRSSTFPVVLSPMATRCKSIPRMALMPKFGESAPMPVVIRPSTPETPARCSTSQTAMPIPGRRFSSTSTTAPLLRSGF